MVQNFDIEIGQEESSSIPIRVQFALLDTSRRQKNLREDARPKHQNEQTN
jgi:hypothetical protein